MDMKNICMGCMSERNDTNAFCSVCGWQHDIQTDTTLYLKPGTIINNYLFGKVLGHGGFGITYLAKNLSTNEVVAIKEYFPGGNITRSESHQELSVFQGKEQEYNYGLEKFRQEANMIQKFNEFPGIVDGKDYFEANNTGYFVMEYIQGITLKEYVAQKGGSVPFSAVKAILIPMMDTLEEMHRNKIIHRDISPDNIYITKDKRIKLLDFGAARQAIGENNKSLSIILKHGFAPKEQYYTKGNQGSWTDVYALAATAYYMLTGKTPQSSLERVEKDELIMPSRLGADISFNEEQVLMTAMSIKENERYQTMKNFQTALLRTGEPSSMQPNRQNPPMVSGQPQNIQQPSYQQPMGQQPSYQQPMGQQPITPGQGYSGNPQPQPKKKSKAPIIILAVLMGFILVGAASVVALILMLGNRAEMPNVAGLTMEEAVEVFEELEIDYKIDDTFEFDDKVDKNQIISQEPEEGMKVKKNEKVTIELIISNGPAKIPVPSLSLMNEADAISKLEEVGLLSLVSYEYSDTVPEDAVISHYPETGIEAANGAEIELIISLGPKPVQNIAIADTATKNLIMNQLGLSGNEITTEDVADVTYLDLSYSDLYTLEGLEYFTNLESLDITGNYVSDITPITSLTKLTSLYMDDNELEVIDSLPLNITYISMRSNLIDTLPDLSGYTSLAYIDLYDNYLDYPPVLPSSVYYADLGFNFLVDISQVANYTNIEYLYIAENEIENISPVSNLYYLTELDISYNYISDFTPIDAIYNQLIYYNDEGNNASYAGGSIGTPGGGYGTVSDFFYDIDDISWELYALTLDDLTNPESYYYIGDFEYNGTYELYGEDFEGYYYEEDGTGLRVFFDEWGSLECYYLYSEDMYMDYLDYNLTYDDAISYFGYPEFDSGYSLVYLTDSFICELFYDEYGNLTNDMFVIYQTDSRLTYVY